MIRVSVIIPNYNHAPFLRQRIESVLGQTYTNFELIILDDCSADNSKEIIETYREHPQISHIVFNQHNSGSTFKQWKKGLSLAVGDIIWIAESDDFAEPVFLETLIKPFDVYPDLAVSYCRSNNVDSLSNFIGIELHADALDPVKWNQEYIEEGPTEIKKYLKFRNTIPNASAVLFKKPSLHAVEKILPLDMLFCGDWHFWKGSLNANVKIAYSPRLLNSFRIHANTTRSGDSVTTLKKELRRFKEYKSFVPIFFFNPFDNRFRWMMEEWMNRTYKIDKKMYKYLPPLHPTLILKYYLHCIKHFFIGNKLASKAHK